MSDPSSDATGRPSRAQALGQRLQALALGARQRVHALERRAPRVLAVTRALFYPCAVLLVAFMGWRAARRTDFSQMHLLPLALSFVAALVWWVCLAGGWALLAGDRGRGHHAMISWCQTQVARYIPGGIWQMVARATTVSGRMRDKVAAVLAENVIVLLVALAVGGLWAAVYDWRWLGLVLLLAAPLLVSGWLEKRTRLSRKRVRATSVAYAVGYVAYGIMGVLVQIAVSGVKDHPHPLIVAGASCVAWAVGLIIIFAPGGVGVREVVYVWMLSGLYPRPELEAAAVASRIVSVMAELSVLLVLWIAGRRFAEQDEGSMAENGPAEPEPLLGVQAQPKTPE